MSMPDIKELLPQIQAVIAAYLDGHERLNAARDRLAALITPTLPSRETLEAMFPRHEPHPVKLHLKTLSPAEWLSPPEPSRLVIETLDLAPGRSERQMARAQRLFHEALGRAADAT